MPPPPLAFGPQELKSKIWDVLGIQNIPLSRQLRCVAIYQPGKSLGSELHNNLSLVLQQLSEHAFGGNMEEDWKQKKNKNWFGGLEELLLIVNSADEIVGFNGYSIFKEFGHINIYIDGIAVLPKHEGIAVEFLRTAIIQRTLARYSEQNWGLSPVFASTRTQNPHVYRLAREIVKDGKLYPSLNKDDVIPKEYLVCARKLAKRLGYKKKSPLSSDLIWRNAYPHPLYDRDVHDQARVSDAVEELFNQLRKKDAFVLVGLANVPAGAKPDAPAQDTTTRQRSDLEKV